MERQIRRTGTHRDGTRVVEYTDGTIEPVLVSAHSHDLAPAHTQAPPQEPSPARQAMGEAGKAVRPIFEGGGAMAGGVIGAASPVPGGAFMGGAGGFAIGKKIADIIEQATGTKPPETLVQSIVSSLEGVKEGAEFEMGGQIAGPAIKTLAKPLGNVASQLAGKMSGAGGAAVKEAAKGSDDFVRAMRGKITGEEIVSNAVDSLNTIKTARADAYKIQLEALSQNTKEVDVKPIIDKTVSLMKNFNVKVSPDGSLDFSRVAMGKKGRDDIADVIKEVSQWGTQPGDRTAMGLDALKRRLDDFYSESSQARAFVSSLRNSVKDTIIKEVPEYAKLTKGYATATKLIKDIENGLMLGGGDMPLRGRVTADRTLKHLMRSMREDPEMRRELIETLGNKGGEALTEQTAGLVMSSWTPRGLAGTGPGMMGSAGALSIISPKLLPILAASSPRVQGEFLNTFGKAIKLAGKLPEDAARHGARTALIELDRKEE